MSEQTSPMHDPAASIEARRGMRPGLVPFGLPRLDLDALTRDTARTLTIAAMLAIVLFGGILRLTHNKWDAAIGENAASGHLHPDERFIVGISQDTKAPSGNNPLGAIANYFDPDTSKLNPYNIEKPDGTKQTTFVYGTLPIFVNKFLASHANTPYNTLERVGLGDPVNATLGGLTAGHVGLPERAFQDYDHYHLTGRWLAGMADIGTIILVFLLGRQLANRNVGLLGAFLYALSAFPIQNAHFFVVDPFVAFFATATIYFAVKTAKYGGWGNFAFAGACAGLAAACKITAVSLVPVVLLAVGVHAWGGIRPYIVQLWDGSRPRTAERDERKLESSLSTLVLGSLVVLLAAFIAFRIAMPYAFKTPNAADLASWRVGYFPPLDEKRSQEEPSKLGHIPIPYPDIMNQHWIEDQVNQERLLGGASFPPNVQWIGRAKWLWPAQQMISWGMGPALGITAWLGVLFAGAYALRKREGVWLVPLAWILGYFGFMGAQFSLYMRYFLPLYPTLAVLAAFLLYQTWRWGESRAPFAALGRIGERLEPLRAAVPVGTRAGVVIVVVFTTLMGLAFYNIYTKPITRAEASCWIYANVPPTNANGEKTAIGHETWDDDVPYSQPGCQPTIDYEHIKFDNFTPDNEAHVTQLLANIEAVDYIVLASDRVATTVPRVPAAYPVTARYYEALARGELGFEKVKEFHRFPSIFGREFNDVSAEESYSVYDHPRVRIYKKTDAYSPERAREVLGADAFPLGLTAQPKDLAQNGLLYKPDVLAKQKAGGTWSDIFDPGDVINRFPLFFWLLAMELAAFALVPLAVVCFRGLPDRGFLLTKPLGILGLAWLAYWPAGYGIFDFTRAEIAGMLALMLAGGAAAGWFWRAEIVPWVRERWRFIVLCEAIFLATFLLSYWIRLQNPDLWHPSQGGEKPMDFAYLNGVIKSTDLTQGPIDPWNAGGYLNYYWYGQFIAAVITKLTGVVPEVAYNLIVPMFFSLAACATFSLTYNLTEGTRRLMRRAPGVTQIKARGPIIAGFIAIFLVLLAGNLRAVDVLHDQLARLEPGYTAEGGGTGGWYWDLKYVGAFIGGFKEIAFGDATLREVVYGYDWWAPSRALTIISTPQNGVTPITEFPFWTFLFADLHAHLMSIPFAMTAAAVSLAIVLNYTRLNPPRPGGAPTRGREVSAWAMIVVLALIVGALRWINSWDYPPFLILGAAALIIAERAKEGRFTLRVLVIGAGKAAVMGALSYALFANVAKNYSQSYNGFSQADQTTALADYFSHFGVFIFLIAGLVILMLARSLTRSSALSAVFFSRRRLPIAIAGALASTPLVLIVANAIDDAGRDSGMSLVLITVVLVVLVGLGLWALLRASSSNMAADQRPVARGTSDAMLVLGGLLVLGVFFVYWGTSQRWGVTVLAFVGLFAVALAAVRELRNPSPTAPIMLFVYAMIGLGLGLSGGVEMLTLDGDIGRMNTVFKFYLHVWMLWGVAGAFSLWYIFAVARPHERFMRRLGAINGSLVYAPRFAFASIAVVLLALTLVYPYFGTRARVHDRFNPAQGTGNDGLEFLDKGGPYNNRDPERQTGGTHDMTHTRDAVNWIRQNVKGSPTTIEAVGPSYRSLGSRISIYTGLPTLSGYGFHQEQQRHKFTQVVQERHADITAFYNTTEVGEARKIIDRYDVEWVIVGDEERFNYTAEGIAKFDNALDGTLELMYENPSIKVYHVIPESELEDDSASAATP